MKTGQQSSTESTAVLGPQQADVIIALMRGATVTDATKQANVDRTTFYLWMKSDANFQAELNRAKQEQMDAVRARLRGLADTAVSTIEEMLTDKDVPPGVRLRAALAVLLGSDTLEDIGKRLLVQTDTTVNINGSPSAAELLLSRLTRLAERSADEASQTEELRRHGILSCNGSMT